MKVLIAVGLLGAAISFANSQGLVIGRDGDGPLRAGHGGSSALIVTPGEQPVFEDRVRVDGDPVVFESAEPDLISPGLELLGPVAGEPREEVPCIGCPGPWPPAGSTELETIANDDFVSFGLRASAPGIYHLRGIRYRYRRGMRRFDERDDTFPCLDVWSTEKNPHCATDDRIEGFEGLAEIGGRSDYGSARFREQGNDGERAVYTFRPGGELALTLTISNLSDKDERLEKLDLGNLKDVLEPQPIEPVTIPAHGHRSVRIRTRSVSCLNFPHGTSHTFDGLDAGDEAVELSVPIEIQGPRECPS